MQNISKFNFKKGSVEMLEPISKHSITKNIQNNNPMKSYQKKKHLIMIQMTTILTIISLIVGM
jgi:hypothetical protein